MVVIGPLVELKLILMIFLLIHSVQLEISVTLRDRATTGLVSTRISSIATIFNKLMGTGDSTDDKNFINMVITKVHKAALLLLKIKF